MPLVSIGPRGGGAAGASTPGTGLTQPQVDARIVAREDAFQFDHLPAVATAADIALYRDHVVWADGVPYRLDFLPQAGTPATATWGAHDLPANTRFIRDFTELGLPDSSEVNRIAYDYVHGSFYRVYSEPASWSGYGWLPVTPQNVLGSGSFWAGGGYASDDEATPHIPDAATVAAGIYAGVGSSIRKATAFTARVDPWDQPVWVRLGGAAPASAVYGPTTRSWDMAVLPTLVNFATILPWPSTANDDDSTDGIPLAWKYLVGDAGLLEVATSEPAGSDLAPNTDGGTAIDYSAAHIRNISGRTLRLRLWVRYNSTGSVGARPPALTALRVVAGNNNDAFVDGVVGIARANVDVDGGGASTYVGVLRMVLLLPPGSDWYWVRIKSAVANTQLTQLAYYAEVEEAGY